MKKIFYLVFIFALISLDGCGWERIRTYKNLDGKYELRIFRERRFYGMPGQSGDAAGEIILLKEGVVQRKTTIPMVSMVEEPVWTDKSVYIHLLIDWPLQEDKK